MSSRDTWGAGRPCAAAALAMLCSGCADAPAGGVADVDLSPQGPTGTCPYKVVTTYDGLPIFSSSCLDNVAFYTSDGKTSDPNGTYTGLRWQCVEWALRYFRFRWGFPSPWGGISGAKDMCEKPASYYADRGIAKVATPIPGDLMVFDQGACNADPTWGHVALVTGEANASEWQVAQQNVSDTTVFDTVSKGCAYCYIHALSNTPKPVEPQLEAMLPHLVDAASTDVDGDGRADVCGRDSSGVRCALGGGIELGALFDGPALSDDSGWDDTSNYVTLRTPDLDGDGRADLCARADAGVRCWISTGDGFGEGFAGPELSDAAGWDEPRFHTTLRTADVDGDGRDDLCARNAEDYRCWPSNGAGFGPAVIGPAWKDGDGWDAANQYGTIQMGDVDGDGRADVCGRAIDGMRCALSNGSGVMTEIVGPAWSDDAGWTEQQYWSTIRLADVDGDGRADLCARSATDWRCHLSTGDGFGPAIVGPVWSDTQGWSSESWYSTIRLGDIDADGDLDLCGRTSDGLRCHRWTTEAFATDALVGPELSDAKSWDEPEYHRTIRLADVDGDGRADVCARAGVGVVCWLSDGTGFPTQIAGPAFSDGDGWDGVAQYATLRIGGARRLDPTEPAVGTGPSTDAEAVGPGSADAQRAGRAAGLAGSCTFAPVRTSAGLASFAPLLAIAAWRVSVGRRRRRAARQPPDDVSTSSRR